MTKIDGYKFWQEKLNGAKLILAPMVEQSELPWRMLTRKYGAQVCYTPMMHASVFCRDQTYRTENFQTCPEDRPLIAQFCTDDPEMFVNASKFIEDKCDAIDLNLGCPQNIARRGHYGSFLQDEWDLVFDILSKGVQNLKIPVTAKIRVFDDIDKSVQYAKMCERAGIALLTVHGRTREQKGVNTGLASWKHIKAIKDAVKIPVFANGNILCYKDVLECLEQTGCDGVMIAEPNLYNPALFADLNPYVWEMGHEYLDFVEKYPCNFACIRGHVFKIFHKVFERFTDCREKAAKLKSIEGLREVFDEVKQLCVKDLEKKSDSIEYYHCQVHIRLMPDEIVQNNSEVKTLIQQTISSDSSSQVIKRHLDELHKKIDYDNEKDLEQEQSKKLVKLLERKRRKTLKIERKQHNIERVVKESGEIVERKISKYVDCSQCKNPRGRNCDWLLCRMCCKNKVFAEEIECKGHQLKFRQKAI